MVCNRCIIVVQNELEKLGLGIKNIKLGEVTLAQEITPTKKDALVKTDGGLASSKATALLSAIADVKVETPKSSNTNYPTAY